MFVFILITACFVRAVHLTIVATVSAFLLFSSHDNSHNLSSCWSPLLLQPCVCVLAMFTTCLYSPCGYVLAVHNMTIFTMCLCFRCSLHAHCHHDLCQVFKSSPVTKCPCSYRSRDSERELDLKCDRSSQMSFRNTWVSLSVRRSGVRHARDGDKPGV